jgi:hypothetical protein
VGEVGRVDDSSLHASMLKEESRMRRSKQNCNSRCFKDIVKSALLNVAFPSATPEPRQPHLSCGEVPHDVALLWCASWRSALLSPVG